MFYMRPDQRQSLDLLEQRSFRDYCVAMHYDPSAHASLLLAAAKADWQRFMTTLQETATNPEAAQSIANPYLSATSWVDYKRLQIADDVDRVAAYITPLRYSLPIDWAYLEQVASEAKIPIPRIADPLTLAAFLKEIPHALIYGVELNAFVTRDRSIGDLPAVFVYEHLMAAVEVFLDIILKQVIGVNPRGNATVVDESLWGELGRSDPFVQALRGAIDMVLLRSDSALIDSSLALSHSSSRFHAMSRFVFLGAGDFVRLHEYGHLLMGHLRYRPRPALELLADRFAMSVLASECSDTSGSTFWARLGAIGALVVLMVCDLIEGLPIDTHPPARARIRALLRDATPESLWLRWHVRAMLAISRNTLQVAYGANAVSAPVR